MDPIDVFPEHLSTTVVPMTLPDKPDALEYAARPLTSKKDVVGQFQTGRHGGKACNEFRPNDVIWEKTSKGLLRNPHSLLKNTDKRMVYIYNNIFFAKKDFTFGLRTVKSGEIHLIQTTHVPMFIYECQSPVSSAEPNPM
ncbi:hypothetical protein TNCV_4064831 [Trichonephila clavipes]|nr:hypothetical protein TNCV_4064831 [Trichonephila clavipes]